MILRLAVETDFAQVLGLMQQLHADASETEPTEDLFHKILESSHLHLLVAELDGQLVASCYLNVIANLTRGGRPYAVIENVITHEAHRGKGIGKAIMARTIELAWENECYKIMLMSGRSDPAVHAFYRRCGFDGDEKKAYILRNQGQ